jgi:hypothetical protein
MLRYAGVYSYVQIRRREERSDLIRVNPLLLRRTPPPLSSFFFKVIFANFPAPRHITTFRLGIVL